MDPLSRQDIDAIADLCRLSLKDDEAERLRTELSTILEHMNALAAADVGDAEPMTHAVPMDLRLRADVTEASLPVEVAVGQAPDRAESYFQVPHILSHSS
ncbi:MAG TPA: Asp-tRNA(Asn)/Glu-tRNA(Gln) amidotransferase subunit GatC [Kofleriaceae bacterium]|nr:Asp-tRNA(Asn)/Glu-tRNA(Gln) amidotransferase subunit GatC [Kofleriaceae bacterium]